MTQTPARTTTAARRDCSAASPTTARAPRFRQLLPYLAEHRGVLVVVVVLSLAGAGGVARAAAAGQPGDRRSSQSGKPLGIARLGCWSDWSSHPACSAACSTTCCSAPAPASCSRPGASWCAGCCACRSAEFDQRRTGDLVSRVGSDTTLLYAVITQGLVDALGGAVVFVGALIAMLIIDPVLLGLTVLVIARLGRHASCCSRAASATASREQQEKVGDLAAAVERVIGAIRTVRAANATEREIATVETDADGRLGAPASRSRRSRRWSCRSPGSRCRCRCWSCSASAGSGSRAARSRSRTWSRSSCSCS